MIALFHEPARMSIDSCTSADMFVVDHRLDAPLDLVLLMLVRCAGLSLDAVLGVVRAYLPRLERGEVVGADDRDLDAVILVVKADDLQAF